MRDPERTALLRNLRRRRLAVLCSLWLSTGLAAAQETNTPPANPETQDGAAAPSTTTPAAAAPPADAKDDAKTLDTVEVRGIRHSIQTSIQTKQESTSIVEAISSEDIGKLPDVSIAESLARLPGLAGQRVDGRAQVIAIRGLSPDFAATLLNGREQVSTGDNRGVEFDQYPSELINAVTVYKTPDATLVGQGLSGTVNLQTVQPLSFGERRISLNARGEYNSLGKQNFDGDDRGYRVSASYIDQFADDTFGVALGVARLDSPFQEQHYKAWYWAAPETLGGPSTPGKPDGVIAWQGNEAWARSRDQVRDGVMGVFEYKPNDDFHSVLDVYYSKFEQGESTRGIMWPQDPWGVEGVYYTDAGITERNGDRLLTSGTVHNVRPIVRNDHNDRDDTLYSAGWNNAFHFDPWTASVDASYSRAKRSQSNLETYAGSATKDSIGFDVPITPGYAHLSPGLDYTDPSVVVLSDPAGWGHDGRLERPVQDDELKSGRLELKRDFETGAFRSFLVGVNVSDRDKAKSSTVYFLNLKNGRAPVQVAGEFLRSPTNLDFVGIPGTLSYDVDGVVGTYYDLDQVMSGDDFRKDFTVSEKVRTVYAKLDIDTDLGEVAKLRGNIGAQLVHTEQSSKAFNIDPMSGTPNGDLTGGTSYNDFLPSLNLISDFGNGWLLRFGAAKTLARARVDDMRASASAAVDPTTRTWSGGGGNPKLEPWRAKSFDLSVEKYFGEASYAAFALFHKKLDTYIYTQTIDYDFSGFTNVSDVQPLSNIGQYSTPANGDGGLLRGAEFSLSLDGGLFSPSLAGFGALLNASYTESSIKPDGPGTAENATLPGLSKRVANATLYYERGGFAARVSERYRSDFRGEIYALFAQRSYTRILPDRQTDVQLSYEFPDSSALTGASIIFQVNNVTNSPYRTVQDSNFPGGTSAPLEYNEYGRQFLLGFSYRL